MNNSLLAVIVGDAKSTILSIICPSSGDNLTLLPKVTYHHYYNIQSNLNIKATERNLKCGLYEQLPFIYRLKLC